MAATAEAIYASKPSELVNYAFSESADVHEATNKLERWAKSNRDLYEYLTAPYLSRACYDAVRSCCRHDRKALYTAPNYTKGGNGDRVHQHAHSLLDFPLPGGKRLRDATRADLEAAANFYRQQAKDMANKADWLEAIAAKVGKKKVGSVLSAEALRSLK